MMSLGGGGGSGLASSSNEDAEERQLLVNKVGDGTASGLVGEDDVVRQYSSMI